MLKEEHTIIRIKGNNIYCFFNFSIKIIIEIIDIDLDKYKYSFKDFKNKAFSKSLEMIKKRKSFLCNKNNIIKRRI